MKLNKLSKLWIGALLVGAAGCTYVTIEPLDVIIPDTPVDFVAEIEPIFSQAGCTMCHTGSMQPNFEAGKAYTSIINNKLADTVNPDNSKLIQKINSGHNSSSITAGHIALIKKWMSEGAKGEIVPVSYKDEVEPLWQASKYNCIMCHGGSTAPDLRTGKSHASLIATGAVVAKDLNSDLIKKINEKHNGAGSITAAELDLIKTWILQGALNN